MGTEAIGGNSGYGSIKPVLPQKAKATTGTPPIMNQPLTLTEVKNNWELKGTPTMMKATNTNIDDIMDEIQRALAVETSPEMGTITPRSDQTAISLANIYTASNRDFTGNPAGAKAFIKDIFKATTGTSMTVEDAFLLSQKIMKMGDEAAIRYAEHERGKPFIDATTAK